MRARNATLDRPILVVKYPSNSLLPHTNLTDIHANVSTPRPRESTPLAHVPASSSCVTASTSSASTYCNKGKLGKAIKPRHRKHGIVIPRASRCSCCDRRFGHQATCMQSLSWSLTCQPIDLPQLFDAECMTAMHRGSFICSKRCGHCGLKQIRMLLR